MKTVRQRHAEASLPTEAPHQSIGKRPGFGRKTGTRSNTPTRIGSVWLFDWRAFSESTASRRDGGDSLPLEYRLITGPRVIGPVARDLNDATRNLIQQGRRQQTTVVDPARCNLHRHNLFRPLIDTQVQLTPGSAPTMSMLSDVPFTRAVHSQARRIHNHVPRPTAWANSQERRKELCRLLRVL